MRKELLLKHISSETSQQENEAVKLWIEKSSQNRQYYKNLKNIWVAQSLPQESLSHEQAHIGAAKIMGITSRINNSYKKHFIISTSVAAVAIIAMCVMMWRFNEKLASPDNNRVMLTHIPALYKHTVYTEKGVKAKITLPDSSQVWLNSGSEIIYPDKFSGSSREIEFKGEGYFKVHKDSLCPMIITTNKNFRVEVMGTEFNLKSYDDDTQAQATLYSGKINLVAEKKGKKDIKLEMKPFETCIIESNKALALTTPAIKVVENTKAWREGRLIFAATPMEEVVKILKRWHGVEIEVKDPKILKYKITADFNSESMVQVAQILKFCALVDYKVDGEKFIFFGR